MKSSKWRSSCPRSIARLYLDQGQIDKAQSLFTRALEVQRGKLGNDHSDTLVSIDLLSKAYYRHGQMSKALPFAEEAVKGRQATLGSDHPQTLFSMSHLAWVYRHCGRLPETIKLHEVVLQGLKAQLGPDNFETLVAMNNLAATYQAANRLSEAFALREEALRRQREKSPDDRTTQSWIHGLALTYLEHGDPAKAEPLYRELLALRRKFGAPPLGLADVLAQYGLSLLNQEKYADAEPLLRESLTIREQQHFDHWLTSNNKSVLGGSLLGQARALRANHAAAAAEKFAAAEPLLLAGYEELKGRERTITNPTRFSDALGRLVQLYETWEQPEKAAKWRAERERLFQGFIQDWLVVSTPFPFSNLEGEAPWDQQQIPGEANLRPREGEEFTAPIRADASDQPMTDQRLVWIKHQSNQYFIDFKKLFGGQRSYQTVAYAVCYVACDAEQRDLVLKVGSDDQAKIYLNGKEVFQCPNGRCLVRDEDQVENVVLERGSNVLVLKVLNQTGEWQGCVRFLDQAGHPAEGLQFRVSR